MKNGIRFLFTVCLTFGISDLYAQTRLSLDEAIQTARESSPDYRIASNQAEASYWNFRNYQARFLPQLSLRGDLPQYTRTITKVTQPDGRDVFVPRDQASYELNMGVRQNVPVTGGTFRVFSNLSRVDVFSDNSRQYSSVPFSIYYEQPSLLYNAFRWEQKIEPLRYEESQKEFVENMVGISLSTVYQYFELLSAQVQLNIAKQNLANTDTLYQISLGRYNLGKIAENELLQMELSLLNARNELSNTTLQYQLAEQNLIRYLGIPKDSDLDLALPEDTAFFNVSIDKALTEAGQNRKAVIEFRRRRLEAEEELARAKGESILSMSLFANFGLNQQAPELSQAYSGLNNQQQVGLTLSIPILDWGVAKSNRRMAEANLELINENIKVEELEFEQEIYQQTAQWNLQQSLLRTAAKARETGIKRYDITKQRYLIGKISITDLNLAQQEKDRAILSYVNALENYWSSYYTIRRLTLYDFREDRKVTIPIGNFD